MKLGWGLALLCAVVACDSGGPATPRVRMQSVVRSMCDCTSPECIAKTREAAMKLPVDDGVVGQLSAFEGCYNAARRKGVDDVIKRVAKLADEMCACKDKKCGDAIKTKADKLDLKSYVKDDDDAPKLTDDQKKSLTKNADKLNDCADKAGVAVPGGDPARKMRKWADKMCTCKDKACTETVHKEYMAWVLKEFKGGKKKGTKKNVERWHKAQKKYVKCRDDAVKASLKVEADKKNNDIEAANKKLADLRRKLLLETEARKKREAELAELQKQIERQNELVRKATSITRKNRARRRREELRKRLQEVLKRNAAIDKCKNDPLCKK